jgi:hypothetical protein
MHTLFFYLTGSDLDEIAKAVEEQLHQFIAKRELMGEIWVVNQQRTADDGILEWELGLNLQLPGFTDSMAPLQPSQDSREIRLDLAG